MTVGLCIVYVRNMHGIPMNRTLLKDLSPISKTGE